MSCGEEACRHGGGGLGAEHFSGGAVGRLVCVRPLFIPHVAVNLARALPLFAARGKNFPARSPFLRRPAAHARNW
jgi:hypothetical protein